MSTELSKRSIKIKSRLVGAEWWELTINIVHQYTASWFFYKYNNYFCITKLSVFKLGAILSFYLMADKECSWNGVNDQ
jgi:hypothetical protein